MENKQMYNAVCSTCGKACQVPFKPTPGKPINCLDCFKASKAPTVPTANTLLSQKDTNITAQCLTKVVGEIAASNPDVEVRTIAESVLDTYNFFVNAL